VADVQDQLIGFVGLGVMGLPMAGHLAAAGYAVTALDLNAGALERLKAAHPSVRIANTPREVAAASDIVVTMLPNGAVVRDAVEGPDGLMAGFERGAMLLDTSSSEPWHTTRTAEGLAGVGVAMVDAPVSGAEAGAKAAELVFMVGGAPRDVERARPLLDVMGKKVFHLGPVGAGHAMKSINNLITAMTFLGTAEGLVIGKAFGLDPAVMTDVLNVSTGMSWITQTHIAQRVLSRRFDDAFKLDLMVKDIGIALKVAADQGLEMPFASKAGALWLDAQTQTPSGASVSELVRAVERRAGVELTSPSLKTEAAE
jgi:3-hydroxyisobutyrate dehydrogenase